MPITAIGFFFIDFITKPFGRAFEQMPIVMYLLVLALYAYVGYLVFCSVWYAERH